MLGNGLYASCLMTALPYSNFRLLTSESTSLLFREIADHLKKVDLDYFSTKAEEEQVNMLIRADMTYDENHSVATSLDVGMFPHFERVALTDLSPDQQEEALKSKRKIDTEPAKLISTMKTREVVDFSDNLLYLMVHQSCKIKKERAKNTRTT